MKEAFHTLKDRLNKPQVLVYLRFDVPFIVERDDSASVVGGVSEQNQDVGRSTIYNLIVSM